MNTIATHMSKYRKTHAQTGSAGIVVPIQLPELSLCLSKSAEILINAYSINHVRDAISDNFV